VALGCLRILWQFFVIPEADSAANGFTDYAQKGFNDYYDPDKDFSKVLEDDEEYIKKDSHGGKNLCWHLSHCPWTCLPC